MSGKDLRLRRIFSTRTGHTLIVPIDHGVTIGPVAGLRDPSRIVCIAHDNGADAVILHKGAVRQLMKHSDRLQSSELALIVHLSASTTLSPAPNMKTLVCGVEEAVALGADAVSVHINLGFREDTQMLRDLGSVSCDAQRAGMPLLAMVYLRDNEGVESRDPKHLAHAARIAEEVGADIVKIPYPGPDGLRLVRESVRARVVVAGGPKTDGSALIDTVSKCIGNGADGIAVGRNIFESSDGGALLARLSRIVHAR